MFEIFITNMLRNSGAKEVGGMMGIANMLKMVLPTFTYGEEEVLFLLGEMEARGEVTRDGESWKIAK
jgi:anaphase-promoting complex subunit 2